MNAICLQSTQSAALLVLAMLAAAPQAVSQQMLAALTVRHQIERKGGGMLTDSFDSENLWMSNFGQYDASVYAGDRGDVVSYDGIVGTIGVGSANIYGKMHTGQESTVVIGSQGGVGSHTWLAAHPGTYQDGWVLQDATNFVFPAISLPYSSGLPLGGPETIVTVIYDPHTTNTVYQTNYYDHVLRDGDYYATDLHGSTIVLGAARLVLPNGLSMWGNDSITIAVGGSIKVFCSGSQCTIGGNLINTQSGYAKDFILECTESVTTFTFNYVGEFIGVLVGPQANMTANGAGSARIHFIGALMMNSLTMNGNFSFHYDEALGRLPGSPPWIILQPQSQMVTVGHPATFAVSVTGSPPLTYQWQFAGTDVPNATNSSFTIPSATTNDAGIYSVIITNGCGSVASSGAVLTVNPLPVLRIGQQGASVVISWPASSGAFLLQSAATPSSGSWNPVALEVVTNGPVASVTVAATNTQAHYRLQGK